MGGELPGQKYCSVGSDNVLGGRKATAHLVRLGKERIVFLGDIEAPEIAQRYQGYTQALLQAGREVDLDLVSQVHFEMEAAEAAVDVLIANEVAFDAIFAASDLLAVGAIRALRRAGRLVPQDVAIVGYDNIQFAPIYTPSLTTISQDMAKAGRLMVSKLLSGTTPKSILSERLPTDLIIRDSCGA